MSLVISISVYNIRFVVNIGQVPREGGFDPPPPGASNVASGIRSPFHIFPVFHCYRIKLCYLIWRNTMSFMDNWVDEIILLGYSAYPNKYFCLCMCLSSNDVMTYGCINRFSWNSFERTCHCMTRNNIFNNPNFSVTSTPSVAQV